MNLRTPDPADKAVDRSQAGSAGVCELALFTRSSAEQAKTRLAPLLGEAGAQAAHIELVEHTIARLRDLKRPGADDLAPGISLWSTQQCTRVAAWADALAAPVMLQQGGNLGERMLHTLLNCSQRAARICLVGTDCPELDTDYVRAAFDALGNHDVVLGPVEDGGYVLIGMRAERRSRVAPMFTDMPFSTDRVAALTIERAQQSGLRVAQLPTLWDVDTPDDWRRYQRFRC